MSTDHVNSTAKSNIAMPRDLSSINVDAWYSGIHFQDLSSYLCTFTGLW